MIALEQARQHLETLGLKQAVEVLDNTLTPRPTSSCLIPRCWPNSWAQKSPPVGNATSPLAPGWLICPSRGPWNNSTSPPALHRRALVKELANLAFVAEATNVLLLGPPAWARPTWPLPWPQGHRARQGAYFVAPTT